MSRTRTGFRPVVRLESLEDRRLLSAGLELLADIDPSPPGPASTSNFETGGSSPGAFRKFNLGSQGEVALFAASSPDRGRELWRTDGTPEGTSLIKDIAPGSTSSNPSDLIPLGDKALFLAQDAAGKKGIWASDGTDAGTLRIDQLPAGLAIGDLGSLAATKDAAYFGVVARDDFHSELWRTDGTPEGTGSVMTVSRQDSIRDLAATSNLVFFNTLESGGMTLWGGDPEAGTVRALHSFPQSEGSIWKTVVAQDHFFAIVKGQGGTLELWTSDGTAAGTRAIAGGFRGVDQLTPIGDRLIFSGTSNGQRRYWLADAEAGTVEPFGPASSGHAPTFADGNTFYFVRDQDATAGDSGATLWASDGTDAGTRRVATLAGTEAGEYSSIAKAGGQLFLYNTPAGGGAQSLLQVDPTTGDVTTVSTVDVQRDDVTGVAPLTEINGRLVLPHRDSQWGREPFVVTPAEVVRANPIDVQSGPNLSMSTGVSGLDRVLATFRHGDAPADGEYTATVDWGDGSAPAAGRVVAANGVLRVFGQHTYDRAGQYDVSVTLEHGETQVRATARGTAAVAEPAGAPGVVIYSAPSSLADGQQTNVFTIRNTGTRTIDGPLLLQLLNAPGPVRTGIGLGTSVQLRPGSGGQRDVVLTLLRPLEPGQSVRVMVGFENPGDSPALVLARMKPGA